MRKYSEDRMMELLNKNTYDAELLLAAIKKIQTLLRYYTSLTVASGLETLNNLCQIGRYFQLRNRCIGLLKLKYNYDLIDVVWEIKQMPNRDIMDHKMLDQIEKMIMERD